MVRLRQVAPANHQQYSTCGQVEIPLLFNTHTIQFLSISLNCYKFQWRSQGLEPGTEGLGDRSPPAGSRGRATLLYLSNDTSQRHSCNEALIGSHSNFTPQQVILNDLLILVTGKRSSRANISWNTACITYKFNSSATVKSHAWALIFTAWLY